MQSFADLGVSNAVVQALAADGVTEPFAVQRLVINDILAGRDVLTRSPTGSGKTLAFGIPMVDRIESNGHRPTALILAPTRELATQIATDIRGIAHARALSVTPVYGGVGLIKQSKLAARSHILVATPGRLEDLLERRAFTLDHIRMLVLDEADRMLDMGFRPAVDRIVRACPRARQTLFFSATLEGEAGTTAQRYTKDPVRHEHGPSGQRAVAEVEHRFVQIGGQDRTAALVGELEAERDLALVFVRTKRGADRLVKRLGHLGVDAVAMHGNKSQRQREVALARFESGAVDTLVATDVAARGIDVTGISHVINFDPPHDHETYVHRIGRTGRAGRAGIGITLVDRHEQRELGQMADRLGITHDLGSRASGGQSADFDRAEQSRPPAAAQSRGGGHHQQRPSAGGRPASRSESSTARRRRRNRAGQPQTTGRGGPPAAGRSARKPQTAGRGSSWQPSKPRS
jgi:ATP-dependent RNA helicase RhlE